VANEIESQIRDQLLNTTPPPRNENRVENAQLEADADGK
jgi:hypothetical protein